MKTENKKPLIQSVERALDILEMIEESPENLRSIDIAERLGLNSNTASNLIRTLFDRGYLAQDDSRKYKLGARCWRLGKKADQWAELKEKALPAMREASEETGESTFLAAIENIHLICVEQVEGNGAIKVSRHAPWNDRLHCSGSGKILLAYLNEKEKELLFKKVKFAKYTENTLTDEKSLRKEFDKIKQQGFAICEKEASDEISAVGVPVFDSKGKVIASMAQSFPSYFVECGKIKIKERAQFLKEIAQKIFI
jgi:DNA-binding IclR family transcriptional regulator